MRDTRNNYVIQLADGRTIESESAQDQSDYFIDNFYSGRITRLWINGVEFEEPNQNVWPPCYNCIINQTNGKLMEQINRYNFSGFNYSATGGNQFVLQVKMLKPSGIGYTTQIDVELSDLERQELIALLITTKDAE